VDEIAYAGVAQILVELRLLTDFERLRIDGDDAARSTGTRTERQADRRTAVIRADLDNAAAVGSAGEFVQLDCLAAVRPPAHAGETGFQQLVPVGREGTRYGRRPRPRGERA